MDRSYVKESPDELLINAERDIASLKVLLSKKYYPENFMYIPICFHVTMAVEKLIKSYIISNGKSIEKTHNLNYLCKVAMEIDASFEKISDDCALLNDFVPGIKYGDENVITKNDMSKIIYSQEKICDFLPLKIIRDSFHQKYQFRIIDEVSDT